jgi:DNA-binding response OmpR family regulator
MTQRMASTGRGQKILVVDDESTSDLMRSVLRRLETEGFRPIVVQPEGAIVEGRHFEMEALFALQDERPAAVLLDVRFGEYDEDRFMGLNILKKIVERDPNMPVLMFTQYAQGPYRDTAVAASLSVNAPVDFIDKLASPDEVLLRLRRLIGSAPETVQIGSLFELDASNRLVYALESGERRHVREIMGMKFEILQELAAAYYRSEGEVVPFSRLERFSEGEDSRASLRVRIREIKVAMGKAVGRDFGADELIMNVRNRGYRLSPPRFQTSENGSRQPVP